MTAIDIVDTLLEGSYNHGKRVKQRKEIEAAGLGDAEDFYLASTARVEPGKPIDSPGVLAAYTHTWPEFERWVAYNHVYSGGNPTEHERNEHHRFYGTPDEWHRYGDGVVYYEGKESRLPGAKGYFLWKVEWSRFSSTNWSCQATVEIEHWDRSEPVGRIWKSHWKQPVLYDYKKDRNAYTQNKDHWDAAHPDYFDTKPFDDKIKAKLVKEAQAFLEKLRKVAKIDKVRWNIPELFQEDKKPSTKGFEQVGGDWGNPWAYGGTWFDPQSGMIVHFDGMPDDTEIQSSNLEVDGKLKLEHYMEILKTVSLEEPNAWENKEDDIRQSIADTLTSAQKFNVFRTTVESDETIESDWDSVISGVKSQFENPDETWESMTPVQKMVELANHLGWHEFDDHPDRFTKADLSLYLGIEL